ncbi:hypothetical protein HanIR_Chr16g0827191 [Helianthus annuus]|nr:hypothetical protein HanIR_Chr16g0827191 [Helianthus annuus]
MNIDIKFSPTTKLIFEQLGENSIFNDSKSSLHYLDVTFLFVNGRIIIENIDIGFR